MTEHDDYMRDPRGYGLRVAEEFGGGFVLDMLRDALNWMSVDEAREFLHANGYAPEEEEEEEEDEEDEDDEDLVERWTPRFKR